jgi:hypothetical protein
VSASIAGKIVEIPAGVTFDGLWAGIPFAAFTDRDPASACYGASFDLPLTELTTDALAAKREEKRRQFATAA